MSALVDIWTSEAARTQETRSSSNQKIHNSDSELMQETSSSSSYSKMSSFKEAAGSLADKAQSLMAKMPSTLVHPYSDATLTMLIDCFSA